MREEVYTTIREGKESSIDLNRVFKQYSRIAEEKDFKKGWIAYKILEEIKSKKVIVDFEAFKFIAFKMKYSIKWADESFKDWITWAIENRLISNREQVINK